MKDNLILYKLQKIHETLSKTKEEQLIKFRMIKSTESLTLVNLYNTTKLSLIRLSVDNLVFNVNTSDNQFLCASVDSDGEAGVKPHISNHGTDSSSNITSIPSYNYK